MNGRSVVRLGLLLTLGLAACRPAPPSAIQQAEGQVQPRASSPQRTLVIIVRAELPSLAAKPLVGFSGSLDPPVRLFNGMLDYVDENAVPHPYLVEALPKLNTDTWRVFADGRMETVHRLRPNLRWPDGTALTAEDFAFALRVYAKPELGVAGTKPINLMESVAAPDFRTVVIKWRQPFPDADRMDSGFQALPRHVLEADFQSVAEGDAQGFINHPFWTSEYMGLGPYKVENWEPGAFLEATAFDGHALGRPKIDRLRLVPMSDRNTALATMLSGEAHYIVDFILGFDEGASLEREWATSAAGTVFFAPVLFRFSQIQRRPEYVRPKALLDVRVRAAIAYAIDAPGGLEVMTGGKGDLTWTITSPRADYYPLVERAITKRPYDPRKAQQLLEESGFARGSDGFYVSPSGERLELEIWNTGGTFETENRIFADSLRKAGIDATPQSLGAARLRDQQFRSLIPGLFTGGATTLESRLNQHSIERIARPENRWTGSNRGAWTNEEFERLYQAWNVTLDPTERIQQIVEMDRLVNEDVGSIPHYFTAVVTAHAANLKGPAPRSTPESPLGIHNIWTWEWTS